MDPAQAFDDRLSGTKVQVIRVPENDVGAESPHFVRVQRLHRGLCPHGHEGRGWNRAVPGVEDARAGDTLGCGDTEGGQRTALKVAPRSRRPGENLGATPCLLPLPAYCESAYACET